MNQIIKKSIKPVGVKLFSTLPPKLPTKFTLDLTNKFNDLKIKHTVHSLDKFNIINTFEIQSYSMTQLEENIVSVVQLIVITIPVGLMWTISYDIAYNSFFNYNDLLHPNNFWHAMKYSAFFGMSAWVVAIPWTLRNLKNDFKKWNNLHTNTEKLITDLKANKPNVEMDNAYKKLVEDFSALKTQHF